MKSLSLFMSRILPHVIGCPDVVAQEALLDTAIEFCEKTLVVRQTLDPLDTEAGALEYELSGPLNEVVILPLQVWHKGTLLQPVAADLVENVQAFSSDALGTDTMKGTPTQYVWLSPSTLGLFPIPDTSELAAINVRAALKPTRTATQLEDVLYTDWMDVLVAGTLARLHATKDQPWSSADRSLMRAREFRTGVQRARMEGSVGRVRASLSVRPRRFT